MQRIALFLFYLYIFWRTRVCWPLLCLGCPFYIFERCLDSNPESCLSKQARYQHSHPSPYSTIGIFLTYIPQMYRKPQANVHRAMSAENWRGKPPPPLSCGRLIPAMRGAGHPPPTWAGGGRASLSTGWGAGPPTSTIISSTIPASAGARQTSPPPRRISHRCAMKRLSSLIKIYPEWLILNWYFILLR